jgi:hypothetical protein
MNEKAGKRSRRVAACFEEQCAVFREVGFETTIKNRE